MEAKHLLRLGAAAASLAAAPDPASAQSWTETSAPITNWQAVACSADGTKLLAAPDYGLIFTSADSGATWNPTIAPNGYWYAVASSADGISLIATSDAIYTSSDSGATWRSNNPSPLWTSWEAVASSADGAKLLAGGAGHLYVSTNSGVTWTETSAPRYEYRAAASSADGTTLIAAGCLCGIMMPGPLLISTNSGLTWNETSLRTWTWNFNCVACSADGTRLAVAYEGHIYISGDSGVTWTPTSPPNVSFDSVASSADGTRLVAAGTQIYTSSDSGASWVSNGAPTLYWRSVASSADGTKLAAAAIIAGGVFTSQSIPAPQLSIAPSGADLLVSWTVPSIDFLLQQNSDPTTTNWTDVPNTPALNLTNLQNWVRVPHSASSRFYRLKH